MLSRLWHCRRGVSALEFALVAPVLALVALGGFDLGNAALQSLRLEAAARAGAQYAFSRPADSTGILAAVRGNLPGWTNVTVPAPVLACRCDNGTTVSCSGGTCGAGTPATYVTIAVSRPFAASTPLAAAILPSMTLQGHAEFRLH
ncbi:MAG TPA: TadE/TadG family type IV pilus assembly protein [Roseomonas sp.]|nr:TadE/TadG family type IV pilus assembly protein [Roseomonas sp.]